MREKKRRPNLSLKKRKEKEEEGFDHLLYQFAIAGRHITQEKKKRGGEDCGDSMLSYQGVEKKHTGERGLSEPGAFEKEKRAGTIVTWRRRGERKRRKRTRGFCFPSGDMRAKKGRIGELP